MQSTATMAENKAFEPDEGVTGKSPPIESLVDRVGIEILLSSWLISTGFSDNCPVTLRGHII